MSSTYALQDWAETAYVRVRGGWEKPEMSLEIILNALTTASGSGNEAIWGNAAEEVDDNGLPNVTQASDAYYDPQSANGPPDYGCLVVGTAISTEVWVLLLIQVLTIVTLLLMDLVNLCIACGHRKWEAVGHGHIPNSLLSWQAAMLRQIDGNAEIKLADTKDWLFGWLEENEDGCKLGFYHKDKSKVRTLHCDL